MNLTHNGKCRGCSSDSAASSRFASGSAQRAGSFGQVQFTCHGVMLCFQFRCPLVFEAHLVGAFEVSEDHYKLGCGRQAHKCDRSGATEARDRIGVCVLCRLR